MKWLSRVLDAKVSPTASEVAATSITGAASVVHEPFPFLSNALRVFPALEADGEGDMDEIVPEIVAGQPDYLVNLRSEFEAAITDPSFSWLSAIGPYLAPFPFDDEEGARSYAIDFITFRVLNDR